MNRTVSMGFKHSLEILLTTAEQSSAIHYYTICLRRVVPMGFHEARHSVQRRQAYDDINYDDNLLADEAGEEDAQNDTDFRDSSPNPVVKEPAIIVTAPSNYEVKVGGEQRLACEVSPNGTVVTWYKDNIQYFLGKIPLQREETRYSIVPNTTDLNIKNVQVSDSGTFRCEVLQNVPVAINHSLLVTEKPKVVNITATNGGVVGEGRELLLTCQVTGSPVPTVMWSLAKNNENVRLSEKDGEFSVNGNVYSMYIKSVKREQAGTYYCYAINKVAHDQGEISVIVNPKPRVHVTKAVVNSDLKIDAVLECAAHEEPRPHIHWYKDGRLIEDGASNFKISTSGSNSNLTVSPTVDEDFGTFTCEAENNYGKHNRSIELVQSPVVDGLEVDGTKLSWTVHSHQPLEEMEVQLRSFSENGDGEWRRLAVPLPEGKHHKYDISYLLEDKQLETGDYEAIVKVKNTKSWGSSSEPAIVKIEDDQPQYIQHASVFRKNSAHSIRPLYTMLSTILMYLLVRMF
ncbi:unnamed protein product [Arctia plantaginis]|uniref:Ig-like domain-containing protein n=1 Tax=Arctia plantaginis TaxID=874455 RepID=A0A8S1AJL1_ARCPL|nr:unnamed protein product [Arctia plantaginis]